MSLKELQDKLNQEWDRLEGIWEDLEAVGKNPIDEWNKYLKSMNCVAELAAESNHYESLLAMISSLTAKVNGDEKLWAVDDPSYEGLSDFAVLLFKRDV